MNSWGFPAAIYAHLTTGLGLYYFVRCFDVSVLIFHFITCLSRFNAKNTKPELQEDWNELADSLKDTLFDLPQESKHSLLKPW